MRLSAVVWPAGRLCRGLVSRENHCVHVLRSSRSGVRAGASSLVHVLSWLVRPIKERRSVRLLGVGKLVIASMMSLLMEYPSEVSMKPAKWAWGRQNLNLSRFREIPLSSQRRRISLTCSTCCRSSLSKHNHIVDYLPDALYPSKGFVHSPVVVLTNGRYSVRCSQIFESAKGGDKCCQLLAFFV